MQISLYLLCFLQFGEVKSAKQLIFTVLFAIRRGKIRGAQRQPLQCNAGVGVHSVRTLEASLVTLWRVLQHLILMPPFPPWSPHKAPTFGGLLLAFLATCRTKNASRRIIVILVVLVMLVMLVILVVLAILVIFVILVMLAILVILVITCCACCYICYTCYACYTCLLLLILVFSTN